MKRRGVVISLDEIAGAGQANSGAMGAALFVNCNESWRPKPVQKNELDDGVKKEGGQERNCEKNSNLDA